MERELSVYTNAPNHRIVIKSNAQGDDELEEAVDYIYGHEEQPQTPPAPRKLNQAKKGKEIGVSDLEYDNGLGGFCLLYTSRFKRIENWKWRSFTQSRPYFGWS